MLQDWACKAEAAPIIMRGVMDPQRDRENGHRIPQDESGFPQRLSCRARDRQSRSHACCTGQAERARAVAVGRCTSSKLDEKMFASYYEPSSNSSWATNENSHSH
jgi:hypothetical protein